MSQTKPKSAAQKAPAKARAKAKAKAKPRRKGPTPVPERESRGRFPTPPIAKILAQWMSEHPDLDNEEIASLCDTTSRTIYAVLECERGSIDINTVDRILVGIGRQMEWHTTLAPYWLDDEQAEQIAAIDDPEAEAAIERAKVERMKQVRKAKARARARAKAEAKLAAESAMDQAATDAATPLAA